MKLSFARSALVLAASLTLASCGGGKATFPINVVVAGVVYPGLILSTNGQDLAVAPPATAGATQTLVFPNQIEYGQVYDVVPKGQVITNNAITTAGAMPKHQTCSVPSTATAAKGTAGQLATITVYYTCAINTFTVGGTISNLTGAGLVLTNGSTGGTASPAAAATTFTLSSPVAYGSTYGVSVLTQPAGQTCSVANDTGTINDAVETAGSVTNVTVTCVNNG